MWSIKTSSTKSSNKTQRYLKLYQQDSTQGSGRSDKAESVMMSKPHTWGKGMLYLVTIRATNKEQIKRADHLKKKSEFSSLHQLSEETIDDFGARILRLRAELVEHETYFHNTDIKDRRRSSTEMANQ